MQVFATCGSADKKAFLMERFPALKEDHIGDSRSTSFEAVVLRATKGAGVHMVLNSLAGDKLQVPHWSDVIPYLNQGKFIQKQVSSISNHATPAGEGRQRNTGRMLRTNSNSTQEALHAGIMMRMFREPCCDTTRILSSAKRLGGILQFFLS
jgi:hypothetical protein